MTLSGSILQITVSLKGLGLVAVEKVYVNLLLLYQIITGLSDILHADRLFAQPEESRVIGQFLLLLVSDMQKGQDMRKFALQRITLFDDRLPSAKNSTYHLLINEIENV